MSTSGKRNLLMLWEGHGITDDKDVLTCPGGRFVIKGIDGGDLITLERGNLAMNCRVLQVLSDEQLMFQWLELGEGLQHLPAGDVEVSIRRHVDKTCYTCNKNGLVAEQDHQHCLTCQVKMPASIKLNCEDCITKMRKALLEQQVVMTDAVLFGGKRTAKFRARSAGDGDMIQEWQDDLAFSNPNLSMLYVLEETKKAALAVATMDDGTGKSPADLVAENQELTSADQVSVMLKHFKPMNDAYHKALMIALGSFDSLVEDACRDDLTEEQADEAQLLVLAEAIATSPEVVYGTVKLWGGLEELSFAVPSTEALDDASAFAENFIQSCNGKISKQRVQFIVGLARTTAYFRGDRHVDFDEDSDFQERLGYLLTKALPFYYLYQDASLAWQRRLLKATEVEMLGKF